MYALMQYYVVYYLGDVGIQFSECVTELVNILTVGI